MSPRPAVVAAALLALAACSKSDPKKSAAVPRDKGSAPPVVVHDSTGSAGASTEAAANDSSDASYQFVAEHPPTAAAGSELVARLVVHPGTGYHINKDYPTKLTLEPPAGVTLAKAVLEPADAEAFDEGELAFSVKMKAAGKGEYTVPGLLKFAVCTESTCNPKKKKVALVLKAE